jgi:hypothetical protein
MLATQTPFPVVQCFCFRGGHQNKMLPPPPPPPPALTHYSCQTCWSLSIARIARAVGGRETISKQPSRLLALSFTPLSFSFYPVLHLLLLLLLLLLLVFLGGGINAGYLEPTDLSHHAAFSSSSSFISYPPSSSSY